MYLSSLVHRVQDFGILTVLVDFLWKRGLRIDIGHVLIHKPLGKLTEPDLNVKQSPRAWLVRFIWMRTQDSPTSI